MLRGESYQPLRIFVKCPCCDGDNNLIYEGPLVPFSDEVARCFCCGTRFLVGLTFSVQAKAGCMVDED